MLPAYESPLRNTCTCACQKIKLKDLTEIARTEASISERYKFSQSLDADLNDEIDGRQDGEMKTNLGCTIFSDAAK